MIRALARFDVDRIPLVLAWPLRDALLAYENFLRERARETYNVRYLTWAVQSPYLKGKDRKPPKPPRLLRDEE